MAASVLSVQEIPPEGLVPTFTAATSDGFTINNSAGSPVLYFKNGTGVDTTITIQTPVMVAGFAVDDRQLTLPANTEGIAGTFPRALYGDTLLVTFAPATGVQVAALKMTILGWQEPVTFKAGASQLSGAAKLHASDIRRDVIYRGPDTFKEPNVEGIYIKGLQDSGMRNILYVKNHNAAPRTLTLHTPGKVDGTLGIAERTVVIPATSDFAVGPVPVGLYGLEPLITFDNHAGVEVACFTMNLDSIGATLTPVIG